MVNKVSRKITYKKALAIQEKIQWLESDDAEIENLICLAHAAFIEIVQRLDREIENQENLG